MRILLCRVLVVVLCAVAAYVDRKNHIIPNQLVLIFGCAGLLLSGSLHALLWKIIGCILLFFLGMFPVMGMGDLKLWMAMCCLIGLLPSTYCIGIGAAALVIHNIFIDKENLTNTVRITFSQILYQHKVVVYDQRSFPFAPYILCGTLIYQGVIFLEGVI